MVIRVYSGDSCYSSDSVDSAMHDSSGYPQLARPYSALTTLKLFSGSRPTLANMYLHTYHPYSQ